MARTTSLLLLLLSLIAVTGSGETLYSLLGVKQDASPAEIRRAYRKKALELHPDKSKGSEAFADTTAAFIKVSEAYSTLSDVVKRREYDQKLRHTSRQHQQQQQHGSNSGISDFHFSLKDAMDVLASMLDRNSDPAFGNLVAGFKLLRASLANWEGLDMPLPELLATNVLAQAFSMVDWNGVSESVGKALKAAFKNEDGSVDWSKVATAGTLAAGAAKVAFDSNADASNRSSELLRLGGRLMSMFMGGGGAGDEL